MVELVSNLQSSHVGDKSKIKRSTSYKSLERTKSTNQKRVYATNSNCQTSKGQVKNNLNNNGNFALNDAKRDRMRSQSPIREGISIKPIESEITKVSNRMHLLLDQNKISSKTFELKNINTNTGIFNSVTKVESPSPNTTSTQTNDKLAPKLRSLRFKNTEEQNSEQLKLSSKSCERNLQQAIPAKCKSMANNVTLFPEENKNIKAEVYISNYNFMNGTSSYFSRCKQPRQSKLLNRFSNDERILEFDDDVDAISNEELGENNSNEIPLRQQIHQTKTTLQLLKINSDGTKSDYYEMDNNRGHYDNSSCEKYSHSNRYEPFSNQISNRYFPIRKISPNQRTYPNQIVDDQSNVKQNIDENDRQSPITSSFTKPLALRRRNRDPYNPTSNNQEYPQMAQTQDPKQLGLTHLTNFKLEEQNIEQENLPRQAQVSDVYDRRIENYYENQDIRSYYREPYVNNESEEYSRYARPETTRQDRYYNYESQYPTSSSYQHDYGNRDHARYEVQTSDYGLRDSNTAVYTRSRRNVAYENYTRY